ncbi:MAG: threonine synthase [Candidatus Nezhaarchaeota archaeon]|nr:threonine synthase [Candidatus Nezhaarchaeota archaeon]
MKFHLQCIECKAEYPPSQIVYTCPKCGDLLDVVYEYSELIDVNLVKLWSGRTFNVWRYRELLPVLSENPVTLNEGGTGLHLCTRLGGLLKCPNIYVKNEGENPTGSFKDRGMTVGVTRAKELGSKIVICASTGNTSASLAAYAAKAGLHCIVLVPAGKIALGKLVQAIAHGAHVIQVRGNFDYVLRVVRKLSSTYPLYLLNSINPYRLEGQRTLSYEVFEQLGYKVPDVVIVPVGNAGNISAIWKGFKELKHLGLADNAPRMIGVQAEGAAPLAKTLRENSSELIRVPNPETVATAIRIGAPVNWKKALRAVKESKGTIITVSDDEILKAQKLLASAEGLFAEPAGAASIAGLARALDQGLVDRGETVVCVVTGHGLKDLEVILKSNVNLVELESADEIDNFVKALLNKHYLSNTSTPTALGLQTAIEHSIPSSS